MQAVLKQFGAGDMEHLQRDIVRGVEGYIVTGSKQVEIGEIVESVIHTDDSRKYGVENTCTIGNTLSKVALIFRRARSQMEKERGNLLKALGTQVAEPLRAMVMGAPLEDARRLVQRYDRMRQDAEAEMVSKRQRMEGSPSSVAHNPVPPPPSYEEVNGSFASPRNDGSLDSMGYFLGEVSASVPTQADMLGNSGEFSSPGW
ncbi:hypothetical protein QJS10_CPB11g00915 [Acorus calamus]|uniref:Uncharacterized protein n=1 Tax=Acorus calamus TaxID=4465 RepID=A0AAV9DQG1_ACOCL|nr:hypothetical protein QJS10_CPB11g00915 [Acorus calamus]